MLPRASTQGKRTQARAGLSFRRSQAPGHTVADPKAGAEHLPSVKVYTDKLVCSMGGGAWGGSVAWQPRGCRTYSLWETRKGETHIWKN